MTSSWWVYLFWSTDREFRQTFETFSRKSYSWNGRHSAERERRAIRDSLIERCRIFTEDRMRVTWLKNPPRGPQSHDRFCILRCKTSSDNAGTRIVLNWPLELTSFCGLISFELILKCSEWPPKRSIQTIGEFGWSLGSENLFNSNQVKTIPNENKLLYSQECWWAFNLKVSRLWVWGFNWKESLQKLLIQTLNFKLWMHF